MIEWLLDRLALKPTRHPIANDALQSSWIQVGQERCELFGRKAATESSTTTPLNVIKFLGAAGRAENVSTHPFEVWPERSGYIWVANPPGYGRSTGRASLRTAYQTANQVYKRVVTDSKNRPFLTGSSFGGTVAISIAARNPVCGLLVRDMPNIPGLILKRHRYFPRIAKTFADRVPKELEVVEAAANCHVPALFVSSRKDRIVPAEFHDEIFEAFAGPKRMVRLEDADHMDSISDSDWPKYEQALNWLYGAVFDESK